jgi:predicted transcriptional regulator
MRDHSMLSVPLSADIREGLLRLAAARRQPESTLAAEAIALYLAHESATAEGIQAGLADMAAGRLVPHEMAMARLTATISSAPPTGS